MHGRFTSCGARWPTWASARTLQLWRAPPASRPQWPLHPLHMTSASALGSGQAFGLGSSWPTTRHCWCVLPRDCCRCAALHCALPPSPSHTCTGGSTNLLQLVLRSMEGSQRLAEALCRRAPPPPRLGCDTCSGAARKPHQAASSRDRWLRSGGRLAPAACILPEM